jgi:hypothetical protein
MKTRTKEFFEGRHLGLMATIIFFAWLGFGIFGQCAGGGDMIKALLACESGPNVGGKFLIAWASSGAILLRRTANDRALTSPDAFI